jgi:hypothetical protein
MILNAMRVALKQVCNGGVRTMHRLVISTGSIVLSLVLGALALAFVGINSPEVLDKLITLAATVKSYIVGTNIPAKYNVWIRLLLEEKQLVFMFFTIMARIVLSLIEWIFTATWRRLSN